MEFILNVIGVGSGVLGIFFSAIWLCFGEYMEPDEIFPYENKLKYTFSQFVLSTFRMRTMKR